MNRTIALAILLLTVATGARAEDVNVSRRKHSLVGDLREGETDRLAFVAARGDRLELQIERASGDSDVLVLDPKYKLVSEEASPGDGNPKEDGCRISISSKGGRFSCCCAAGSLAKSPDQGCHSSALRA